MILEKSVHTVHFCFLFIKIIGLGGEWFNAGCTLVCTGGNHLGKDDQKLLKLLLVMSSY